MLLNNYISSIDRYIVEHEAIKTKRTKLLHIFSSSSLILEWTEGPKVITCEGKSSKLSCSSPSYIEVTSATWGQSSDKTCFWDWRNCVTLDVLSKAKRQCDSKHFCKVTANTATYGSTCYGIVKALAISYSCTGMSINYVVTNFCHGEIVMYYTALNSPRLIFAL